MLLNNNLYKQQKAPIIILLAVLALMAFFQYLPSKNFGFLGWDDTAYIQEDRNVTQGLNEKSLSYAFTTFDNPYFMPITRLSYMLDVSLYGVKEAGGYRLTNIIIHIINTLLLFLLVYFATYKYWPAFVIALIFGLHPQHVEAVVWIAGRKELLAGLFGILSLFSYQQYAKTKASAWYLLTVLMYGCSLFSKPIWIALPILLLVWDYFPLKRINADNVKKQIIEKMPILVLGLLYSLIFTATNTPDIPVSYYIEEPWHIRWMLPFIAIQNYVFNTVIPMNLVPYYGFPEGNVAYEGVFSLTALAIVVFISWRLKRELPGLLMAIIWFILALAACLKITLFPMGEYIFFADRYSYLPHIGLLVGTVLSIETLLVKQNKYIAPLLMTTVVIISLWISKITIDKWKTPESLWLYTIENTQGKAKAYVFAILGSHYESEGRYQEAFLAYRKAHEINSVQYVYPLVISSLLKMKVGKIKESDMWLDKIVDESPAPAAVLFDIGKLEYINGRMLKAERFLAVSLDRNKKDGSLKNQREVYWMLGLAQLQNNHINAANETFAQLKFSPEEKTALCADLLQAKNAILKDWSIAFCQK